MIDPTYYTPGMAMSRRKDRARTPGLWVATNALPRTGGHPFYQRLNQVLDQHGFDAFVEAQCATFYAPIGRPSLLPGTYFRLLLIGHFEGLDSERGIAWRTADSLALRGFLGLGLDEPTPEHSTISRTRRLLDLETHRAVFTWILQVLATADLVKGTTIGIDATTLKANAALRSIVRPAVAALGARLLGRGGDNLFEFGIEPDARHAPTLGLDARPLVQRGAVHGRVMGQFGGFHQSGPRLLLGDVAGVDRRALCSVSPAFGRGEHVEALALRPGRLVFLDQPGADHVVDAAPGGVGVAVKMLVGQVCVGHGAIEPHVGHRIARACGPAAARPVARLGVVRARGVFPPMAGGACLRVGLRAGFARVLAGGIILAIPRILARPVGRVFLADAGKPGVVRLVVGALLRGPLGMLARAGGFLRCAWGRVDQGRC